MEMVTTELHRAAIDTNLTKLTELIEAGADLGAIDEYGKTALHHCRFKDQIQLAQALLDAGADLNASYVDKRINLGSPLLEAAGDGLVEMVEFFLGRGADKEKANALDRTPLDIACHADRGNLATVKLLVEAGANLESVNFQEETPLFSALRSGKLDVVSYLMEQGARADFVTAHGRNILFALAEALPRYCFDADIEIKAQGDRLEMLTFRANNGNTVMRSFEVKEGGEPREGVINNPAEKAKLIAEMIPQLDKKKELLDLARLFIGKGVSAAACDSETKTTVLPIAGDANCPIEYIDLLAGNGADVKAVDKWGLTALHYTTRKGHDNIVARLIELGADANAADEIGFTPLHEAAENNRESTARLLIERGANTKAGLLKGFDAYATGFTPLDIARVKGFAGLIDILS